MEEGKAVTITIPQDITRRPWWDSEKTVKVWLVLLMQGAGAGGVRMSLRTIASTAGLSLQNVRTAMAKLTSSGDIVVTHEPTHDSTHEISYIRLRETISSTTEAKVNQHTDQHTTQHKAKGVTKVEKEEKMKARMKEFYDSLVPHVATYGRTMVREFFDYWTEPNKSRSAMRFEGEKTWDLVRRLDYWQRRSSGYGKGKNSATTGERYAEGMERINMMFDGNNGDKRERKETWEFPDGPDEQ